MNREGDHISPGEQAAYDRRYPHFQGIFSTIGDGEIGGKARGLVFIKDALVGRLSEPEAAEMALTIPTSTVIATGVFDAFLDRNRLRDLPAAEMRDEEIAHAFLRADLPTEILGDLRALSLRLREPIAVRSSSYFEDALDHPFAGVYATKMVPNNQPDADTRFRVLLEAIKLVYASTFFKEARAYALGAGGSFRDEKMAVLIQAVVGTRFGDRFYPHLSGVGRSFNYYRTGNARPEDGIVSLALGLGKTIVDGGVTWNYPPSRPKTRPPYKSFGDMLKQTQTAFWAVNMGRPPEHDPIHETEYLVSGSLADAEADGTLRYLASTYQPQEDRLTPGIGRTGPRVLTFSPILELDSVPLNDLIGRLLGFCREALGSEVELEFAATLDPEHGVPARLFLLQVRPMRVARGGVSVPPEALAAPGVVVASDNVLGNGEFRTIRDVVHLKEAVFGEREAWLIAAELEAVNDRLGAAGLPYLLIAYGRLGSTDAACGVPVNWGQISGARAIVEVSRPDFPLETSQGSHFFHNVMALQVGYFSVLHGGRFGVDWAWLGSQPAVFESAHLRHVRLAAPLSVRIDGGSGRGVISR